jgi:cation diffusion facilitator CzcD-associated flavoprotein CzcO
MGTQGPMKVAIIGGGAAGLAALRHAPVNAAVTLFEKKRIGGLWQLPGPMYDNLHTNLPYQVMAYPDFPFPNDTPS